MRAGRRAATRTGLARRHGILEAMSGGDALAGLEEIGWAGLRHAYGPAGDVPGLREAGAEEQVAVLADRLPGQACLSSSASKRAARIGSGLAGRLTAARPKPGVGRSGLMRPGSAIPDLSRCPQTIVGVAPAGVA